MKSIKFLSIACILSIFLVACSGKGIKYVGNISMINSDIMILTERYSMVRDIAISKWDKLSVSEQTNLKMIDSNVNTIIAKIELLKSLDAYKSTPEDINYIYALAKDSYLMAKDVVNNHRDDLSRSEKIRLNLFDQQIKSLDEKIQELINDPDEEDMTKTLIYALSIASSSLKIIIPIISAI